MRQSLTLMLFCSIPLALWAHSADRGFVLLLPTTYYVAGGTLAVLASALLFSLLGPSSLVRYQQQRVGLRYRKIRFPWLSLSSTCILLVLILIGLWGNTDPLANPLPLIIWTLFWVLLTLLHAIFGNIWHIVNPWSGVLCLLRKRWPGLGIQPAVTLPPWLGFCPAIVIFILFAWFELVSLAPEDPPTLARIVMYYWLFTLMAMLLFGEKAWVKRGEAFSVFFGFIALLSPLGLRSVERSGKQAIVFRFPASELLHRPALSLSAAIFVLVTLASVSFDGLNKTFWWLSQHGINPLAFEGRSSVVKINTIGLGTVCLVLIAAYTLAISTGWWLERITVSSQVSVKQSPSHEQSLRYSLGLFALAILPISLGYHSAHYLTQLLVNGQYLLKALSDPFGRNWNLLGTADFTVTTSFLSHHHSVERLWQLQLSCIVLGHILSALIAHLLALRLYSSHRAAVISQLPLALLMVLYTCFGLWLLSTPTGL